MTVSWAFCSFHSVVASTLRVSLWKLDFLGVLVYGTVLQLCNYDVLLQCRMLQVEIPNARPSN